MMHTTKRRGSWVKDMNSLLMPDPSPALDVLDLFCGAGGLSLGFRASGFSVKGIDRSLDAAETFSANLGKAECADLFNMSELPSADIVIAGPPCQPWSRAGKRGGGQDKRDGFSVVWEAIRSIEPMAVVVENVPDLARPDDREHLDRFERELKGLDYLVEEQVINAANYGVPQNRRRIFVTGIRNGNRIGVPKPWPQTVTVRSAIPGTYWRKLSEARPVSEGMSAYIERYERASGCRTPRDLHLDQPARTLTVRNLSGATGDMIRLRLPDNSRRTLTVREAARLQSFPDWFQFYGTNRSKFEQIGNAVPPLLALAVAGAVYKGITGFSTSDRARDDRSYPLPSSPAASATMRANRRRDTLPERRLRSALHRQGRRFRIDLPVEVSGRRVRPDIVFTRRRVAVFVDGCFWHACPVHGQLPRANESYWMPKLRRNQERDQADDVALQRGGWTVVRLWEHEHIDGAVAKIQAALETGPESPDLEVELRQ